MSKKPLPSPIAKQFVPQVGFKKNINTQWHAKHKMPGNPTMDQRVKWHLDHTRHCSCRPIPDKILKEMKKRYINTHQEFWINFNQNDHQALALWAAECAEHVLLFFEEKYPEDPRPREALKTLGEWVTTGTFRMPVIRSASLAAHASARSAETNSPACFAARAAGQAVATAHAPTHAFGSALYAWKAVAAANPSQVKEAITNELEWQLSRLPGNLKEWVESHLKQLQQHLPKNLRSKL